MALFRLAAIASVLRGAADRIEPVTREPRESGELGEGTLKRLEEHAAETFKREVDLDESVWRTLPFMAATFAFVAAVVGKASTDMPAFSSSFYNLLTRLLLFLAVASLAWALRWFFVVLRPREYEYPAATPAVQTYAEEMSDYHSALGFQGEDLDAKVVEELRLFMVSQYASAVGTNQRRNAVRFEARGKVLLFMLIGFVLAFSCEAIIFIHRDLYGPFEVQSGKASGQRNDGIVRDGENVEARTGNDTRRERTLSLGLDRQVRTGPPVGSKIPARDRGGEHMGAVLEGQDPGEAMMAKGPVKPTAGGTPPTRPVPPRTQFVAKLDDRSRVDRAPPPKPKPKPSPKK